jgi:hypothetical protein
MRQSEARRLWPLFTSSWDDGHPLDIRLAELHQRHGFRTTFYVPTSNREGLPVMSGGQIRDLLAGGFEIGSHTLDHCYLTSVDDATAQHQIVQGKALLEQALGQAVPGFCYPGGKYRKRHRDMVRAAGFAYARTTENLHSGISADAFSVPVTLQFYPHPPAVFLRNFIRYGSWWQRSRMLSLALSNRDLLSRLKSALDAVCLQGGVFHLWGHSWELDQFGGWGLLDDFLSYAAERIPAEDRLTNLDVLRRRSVLP